MAQAPLLTDVTVTALVDIHLPGSVVIKKGDKAQMSKAAAAALQKHKAVLVAGADGKPAA